MCRITQGGQIMYQQIKRIITIVLIVVVLIGALLYFLPWPTCVNLTLNAAKLDKDGNAVGNSTITIKGVMLDYLFQEDCLNVSIYPCTYYRVYLLCRVALNYSH